MRQRNSNQAHSLCESGHIPNFNRSRQDLKFQQIGSPPSELGFTLPACKCERTCLNVLQRRRDERTVPMEGPRRAACQTAGARFRFSFDATLAQDSEKFLLVKDGWKKDLCVVCRWKL